MTTPTIAEVQCPQCGQVGQHKCVPSVSQGPTTQVAKPVKPSIGRIVHFAPPSDCVGPKSPTVYPAFITQVNEVGPLPEGCGTDQVDTVELTTFGPNSVYFQHKVPFSEEPKPGFWSWPPRRVG